MSPHFAPQNLDVEAFARQAGHLSGTLSIRDLPRLDDELRRICETLHIDWDQVPVVAWQAHGAQRDMTAAEPQSWMQLKATARLPMLCQRCLDRMDETLELDYWFRFVESEAVADAEDDDADEDLLVTSRHFDLITLVEDELLMALPLVPMHDVCPAPVPMQAVDPDFDAAAEAKPHPFAGLAALKGGKTG